MNNDDLSNKNVNDNQKLSNLEKDLDDLMQKAKKEVGTQDGVEVSSEEIAQPSQAPAPVTSQPSPNQTTTSDISENDNSNNADNTTNITNESRVVNQDVNNETQGEELSNGKTRKVFIVAIILFVLSLIGLAFYLVGAAKQGRVTTTPTSTPPIQTPTPKPTLVATPLPSETEMGDSELLTTATPSAAPQNTATPSALPSSTPGI